MRIMANEQTARLYLVPWVKFLSVFILPTTKVCNVFICVCPDTAGNKGRPGTTTSLVPSSLSAAASGTFAAARAASVLPPSLSALRVASMLFQPPSLFCSVGAGFASTDLERRRLCSLSFRIDARHVSSSQVECIRSTVMLWTFILFTLLISPLHFFSSLFFCYRNLKAVKGKQWVNVKN